jgi:GH25 family lysozyme M1 (1,4-beta-N-acetylmuramidase)
VPRTGIICAVACLLAAFSAAPAAGATTARVPGVDVSRFQKSIDWQQVAGDGVQFAFVQASRGSGADCSVVPRECGPDAYYAANYAAAKAAGVRVGPYHRAFVNGARRRADVKADAEAEAAVFIESVVGLLPGDLRPALDMESPFAGMSPKNLRLWTRTWIARVRAGLGRKPIIYTNLSSWTALGNPGSFARNGYRLWVANWNVASPLMPANNWAGKGWRVWQHSSTGKVDGIKGHVDLNWLQGGWSGLTV